MELRIDRSSPLPLAAQLAAALGAAIEDGRLAPGDQLPSLRHVAAEAGVNINTVRAAYGRLESQGAVQSEQGRGTFVAPPSKRRRQALRTEIERLEAELVRLPRVPRAGEAERSAAGRRGAGLLSTEALAEIRDELLEQLRELDAARAEVIQGLRQLEHPERSAPDPTARRSSSAATRRSSPTLSGARVRWVGA